MKSGWRWFKLRRQLHSGAERWQHLAKHNKNHPFGNISPLSEGGKKKIEKSSKCWTVLEMLRFFHTLPPRLWLESTSGWKIHFLPCLCTDLQRRTNTGVKTTLTTYSVEISAFLAGEQLTQPCLLTSSPVQNTGRPFLVNEWHFTTLHPVLRRLSKVTEEHFSWFKRTNSIYNQQATKRRWADAWIHLCDL